MIVWVLSKGSGEDGDEWALLGIYSSQENAIAARSIYERPRQRVDGSIYNFTSNDPYEFLLDSPLDELQGL
jgi:hypothetical protein